MMRTQSNQTETHLPFDQGASTLVEGVAIGDDCGYLIFVNHALEQLLGYGPGDLVGKQWTTLLSEASWSQKGLGKRETSRWERVPEESSESYEARLKHKDGSTIRVLTRTRLLFDGEQRPKWLFGFTPLDERAPSPAGTIPRSPEPLEDLSSLGGLGRIQAQIQQQERMASLGRHVSSIAHELRNPLTIILLQARLLHKAIPAAPQMSDSLDVIQNQANRIGRMVDDLLTFGRTQPAQQERIEVNALIQHTLRLQHPLAEERIQIDTELEPDLPYTRADPDQLRQVFVNLIDNAIHAIASRRSGTPGTLAPPGRLTISTALCHMIDGPEPRIQVRFADNGHGIPDDVMPHIFQPFFTTKKHGQGTGLGLSICERIIHEHGGRIWAQNNQDGGATLILELPVVATEQGEILPFEHAQCKGSKCWEADHRILVVDDEPRVARTTEQILMQAGFEVAIATDGQQALSMLEQGRFDLIISDVNMPKLNGQQFHRLVAKSRPELAKRIIFSSGDSGFQKLGPFLRENGNAWINKPFKADELLYLVHKTLQQA